MTPARTLARLEAAASAVRFSRGYAQVRSYGELLVHLAALRAQVRELEAALAKTTPTFAPAVEINVATKGLGA